MRLDEVAASVDSPLGEGNSFSTTSADHPLTRNVVVSIRATLNDLCLSRSKATWQPSPEALRSIFQQRKFLDLNGSSEMCGDLKSVVLHDMKIKHVKSSFPLSVGARITGVDDSTFALSGDSFSTIVLPHSESSNEKVLQSDDVSLAYEFARKFPGYTAANLSEKGVHEVSQRRFVLVAADHPIVSAITENSDKLQMGEISVMPEGLVKISQSLYESILPAVRNQVETQIKVRDLSKASVSIAPADHSSWSDARSELMVASKRTLKAQLTSELAGVTEDAERAPIEAVFAQKEANLEHRIDNELMSIDLELAISYNFLSA
jgi:hypothetical protein